MAMSKRCFLLLLLVVVVALGGGVAIVVWIMNKNANGSNIDDYETIPTDYDEDNNQAMGNGGFPKTAAECIAWSKSKSTPMEFVAKLGQSKLATRESLGAKSGFRIVRNAYWLTGELEKDNGALNSIEISACQGQVPVIVIKMRPKEGLQIHHGNKDWEFYKPVSPIATWKDYDRKLESFLKRLTPIPSLVILEPDLLMYAFDTANQQYRWLNSKYEEEFLKRAQRIIKRLKKSWIYLDAGNAAYLTKLANVEQMALTLNRLTGLRGFSINAMHFVNRTYNEAMARRIHCRTGLHYVVDTSRNGGQFSMQSLSKMENCLFDPPNVRTGQRPGWSWGSKYQIGKNRRRRWIHQYSSSGTNVQNDQQNNQQQEPPITPPPAPVPRTYNQPNQPQRRPQYGHRIHSTNPPPLAQQPSVQLKSVSEGAQIVRSFQSKLRTCASKSTFMSAHDASVWLKTPGESDGRLYNYGSLHSCLIDHSISCDDSCQMITNGEPNQRSPDCQCERRPNRPGATNNSPNNIFSGFPFGINR
uniref:Uncharacterized protein LOC100181482 n=1 Tax=Phallusia mammillata TaxID=59560 RepID=A0A6F9DIC6_9ASCI|nr:uncharacterized protein LOC100181482 [Phallusia mammillata]